MKQAKVFTVAERTLDVRISLSRCNTVVDLAMEKGDEISTITDIGQRMSPVER